MREIVVKAADGVVVERTKTDSWVVARKAAIAWANEGYVVTIRGNGIASEDREIYEKGNYYYGSGATLHLDNSLLETF